MAKRDVDSVDPADAPKPIPERIQLAERWRVVGVKLRKRSPAVFAKVFEMLVTCEDEGSDDEAGRITNDYRET